MGVFDLFFVIDYLVFRSCDVDGSYWRKRTFVIFFIYYFFLWNVRLHGFIKYMCVWFFAMINYLVYGSCDVDRSYWKKERYYCCLFKWNIRLREFIKYIRVWFFVMIIYLVYRSCDVDRSYWRQRTFTIISVSLNEI